MIIRKSIVVITLIMCSVIFMATAAQKQPTDKCSLSHLETKTVALHNRYVRVPWGFSEAQHKQLTQTLPSYKNIVEVKTFGGKLKVYVAGKIKKQPDKKVVAGKIIDVDLATWKAKDTGKSFEYKPHEFIGDDMAMWRAFLWLAKKNAKQNGEFLSQKQSILFVPGSSFDIKDGKITLTYFKGARNSTPENLRYIRSYAIVEIADVSGLKKMRATDLAYVKLLGAQDLHLRDAALNYIVVNKLQSNEEVAKRLNTMFSNQDLAEIPPMASLVMGNFDLNRYIKHANPRQRGAAVFASRWWRHKDKLDVLLEFLEDNNKHVVDQTIYEIGYIGDKSVLKVLSDPKFNKNAFIDKVRNTLKNGEKFK